MSDFSQTRLVLFDLDGTLVDSVPDLAQAVNVMLLALELHAASETEVRSWVGNGIRKLVERALASRSETDTTLFEHAEILFRDAYADKLTDRSQLYPGAAGTLDTLRRLGLRLACVTNKDTALARELLSHFDLLRRLDWAAGSDSVSRGKPDPELLFRAMRECGSEAPEHTLMVGDSQADVGAARAAGVPIIAVSYGYNQGNIVDEGPDRVIDALSSLPGLLARAA